ncbi:hypothetical protein JCM8097_002170 [Rhodosporidiobolus ruineniae]
MPFRVPHLWFKNLSGNSLVWLASTTAGFGFILFGCESPSSAPAQFTLLTACCTVHTDDQGVMGGLITLPSFLDVFPECNDPDISGITVAIYEIGCMFGAIATMIWGDRLGRKQTIALGMVIMCIGAVIKTASYGLAQMIVGRIVTGFGNGMNTATVPTLQSELAPPAIRGSLILISGALIAAGIAVSYAVGLGFYFVDSSAAWRFPLAFQILFALIVLVMLLAIPESPAWLIKHADKHPEYMDEAKITLKKIYDAEDDDFIDGQVHAIQAGMAEVAAYKFKDLFTHGPTQNFRRASIGFFSQVAQQFNGCNIVTYYATYLFENNIGLSPTISRVMSLAVGVEYTLAAFLTVKFVDRMGRRKTMLIGEIGCAICMAAMCGLVYVSDNQGNKSCAYAAVAFVFLFETVFAFGLLGQTWLYPAEITSLPIRAQANGASTVANWLSNFVVVMVTPPGFDQIGSFTYLVFAIITVVVLVPGIYFFFPEPARRSLEEMDLIFAEAWEDPKGTGGYVRWSLDRPHISGKELDRELQAVMARAKSSGRIDHIEVAADAVDGRGPGVVKRFFGGASGGKGGAALKQTSTQSSNDTLNSGRPGSGDEKNKGEVVMRELA